MSDMPVAERPSRSLRVRRFFDAEVARYVYERYERPSCEQLSYRVRKSLVLEMARDFSGRVCDLGCGPGILTGDLANRGLHVMSVDLSLEMLKRARADMTDRIEESSFLCADVTRLPLASHSLDHVVCIGVLGYLPSLGGALEEIRRVLKPRGTAVIQFSNIACPWARVTGVAHALLKAMRLGQSHELPFPLHAHWPPRVKRQLSHLGFRILAEASYDFRLPFMEKVLPASARRWSMTAQALQRTRSLGWLGEGRLIKVAKEAGTRPTYPVSGAVRLASRAIVAAALAAGCLGGPAAAGQSPTAWEHASATPLLVPLRVDNASRLDREHEPVTTGLPLARASGIQSTRELELADAEGIVVPAQFRVLARWGSPGDGPIRWVLVDWQADVPPRGSATYYLRAKAPRRRGPDGDQASAGFSARGQADRIVIDTGPLTLVVPKKGGYLFETLFQGATYRTAGLRVLKGKDLYHSGEAAPSAVVLEEAGPLRAVVRVEGTFRSRDGALLLGGDGRAAPNPTTGNPRAQGKPLEYTIRVTAFKGKPYLKVVATIENNGNGGWDGAWYPSNDVFFDGLYLDTTVPLLFPATITSGSLTAQVSNQQSFVLRQGHEVAHEYDESMNFFYETSIDGQRKTQRGRSPGWLEIRNREGGLTLAVRRFWQNYPKSIELADGVVSVGLWPRNDQDPEVGPYGKGRYFFSGGWHKTHEIMLAFSVAPVERAGDDPTGFLTPLVVQASPQWHVDSKGWGLIAPSGLHSRAPHLQPVLDRYERYQRILIDPEVSSDRIDLERIRETRGYRNWFSCDWYGWEDFGDLMHGGNPCQPSSLIYDWPYIMWLQYVRSADRRFRTLAEEMTDHSRDLDQHHNEDTNGRPITAGNIVDGVWNYETGRLRGHHMNFNSAGNIISHTWNGGYALGYALTGNPGYLDAARRSAEAGRRFWAKAIAGQPIAFEETRSQGWSILMLVNLYKATGDRALLRDAMQIFRNSLLHTEQLPHGPGSGGGGYIAVSRNPEQYYLGKIVATFATYHLEPLAELHWEAGQAGLDVADLEAFLLRSLDWLKDTAYVGGVCLGGGRYVPLTLSYATDPVQLTMNRGGTIGMNSLVAGLAGYAYIMIREQDRARAEAYLGFARRLFRDLMYFKEVPRDERDGSVDADARSLITWSSWPFTAPKELGWIGRGGQPYLHVEYLLAEQGDAETPVPSPCASSDSPFSGGGG